MRLEKSRIELLMPSAPLRLLLLRELFLEEDLPYSMLQEDLITSLKPQDLLRVRLQVLESFKTPLKSPL